jgi:hypothetical protein
MEEVSNPQVELRESVEMEVTAKGLNKWTIKLREEKITEDTLKRLLDLDQSLRTKFPKNVYNQ